MDIYSFYCAGINYKKTDASVRGCFAINATQYSSLLEKARQAGLKELFVLSTCNRTEIYGLAHSACELTQLLCSETSGSHDVFKELAYVKQGPAAVEHLYNVAAGLDSQILGDYEIVGQLKQAVKFAKENGFVGTLLERMINGVLQASKAIKSCTQLSSGTVSVSFAAIQFLKAHVPNIQNKKILLLGTGKIGASTCKNIVDYIGNCSITLLNRTEGKAESLAKSLGVEVASYDNLNNEIEQSDVIIVATNACEPVIRKEHVLNRGNKVLIDLSIPNNIDTSVKELPYIQLVNVDQLSKLSDQTLQKRLAEVPKAKGIIAHHMQEFKEWYYNRKYVPVLLAVKEKLIAMHDCSLYASVYADEKKALQPVNNVTIQKVINNMAVKMRCTHQPGCNYIQAINDYIGCTTN